MVRQKSKRAWAVLAAAGIGVGAISLLAGPVQAAPPGAERLDIEDSFEFQDPFFAGVCGVEAVEVSGDITVKGWVYEDGSGLVKERLRVEFSNPATGDVVWLNATRNFDDAPLVETSADGFTTLVFESVVTGAPERWSAPGVGTIVMDRGRAVIRTTIVFDESTGEEVAFSNELIDSRGSHSIAANGFELDDASLSQVCSALGGAFVGAG